MRLSWVTRRRVLTLAAALLVAAIGYTVWLGLRTSHDLREAQRSVDELQVALDNDDAALRVRAIEDLQESASSARERTGGAWWAAMTHLPVVGDDASGVRSLSEALDLVATDAVAPLGDLVDGVDGLVHGGRIDVEALEALQQPVDRADAALGRASDLIVAEDSSGFVGRLQVPYDDFSAKLHDLSTTMSTVSTALDLAPSMLGADGPRTYLLIFQNNAEIRATGGLPGSWVELRVEDGRLQLRRQGSANDFPSYPTPVAELTPDEKDVFGVEMARFFQDPNFTPDFPRAAQIFDQFWRLQYPQSPLDGIVSIDVVALSYALRGLGPVDVGSSDLTPDNAVASLLSSIYEEPDPNKQDDFFEAAARATFGVLVQGPTSSQAFVEAIATAAREGRLLMAPFHADEAAAIEGTRVAGELTGDDGATPHVDLAFNDATASKMSYYLRYAPQVRTVSCDGNAQTFMGSVDVQQTISLEEARDLPEYVTGVSPGTPPGTQLVRLHIIGPYGGTLADLRFDGRRVRLGGSETLNGRPVMTAAIYLDSTTPVRVTWSGTTGAGQVGDMQVDATPSVVPGDGRQLVKSACAD